MKAFLSLCSLFIGLAFTTKLCAGPVNDLFANRIVLAGTDVTVQGSNAGAGEEPGEDIGGGTILRVYSVWYAWTAPTNGIVHFSGSTTVGDFYLSIRAYRGNAVDALTLAATTPDGGVPVTAGDSVVIQVTSIYYPIWGGGGGTGPFTLMLSLEVPAPTSPNDAFTNRLEITGSTYSFDGSIYGATNEPGEPLPAPNLRQTLWWKVAPPETGLLTLTPSAPQFTPTMRVYQGNQLNSLVAVSAVSGLTYQVESGYEYAVQMAGDNVGAGHANLDTRFYAASNDMFAGSLKLEGTNITVHGDTLAGTFEPNEPNPGGTNTIWFSWEAPATGRVWFSPGPNWWRFVAVYTGPTVDRLTSVRLVGADNGVFCFLAEAGTVYHLQYAGGSGDFTLSLQLEPFPPCANDEFASAQIIRGQNSQDRRPVAGATLEVGEPAHLGATPAKSIWWKWQAPVHGRISFYSERSLVPSVVLAVYRGSAVEALTLAAKSTDSVAFNVTGGETYFLAAAVPESAAGDVLIYWQYNSTSSASRAVAGNLLHEPSWEGTGLFGAQYWGMSGEIGGYVGEAGGADGTTWPLLGSGAQVWQDFATVPGQNHAIRFACTGAAGPIRVTWDDREIGAATLPADETWFWHWPEFTAFASNTTSRIKFQNLGGMFANMHMDAFSVVPLTAPPQIITQPSSASVVAGGTAAFIVGVSGSSPLTYEWHHNDSFLTVLTNSLLLLESVTTDQAGTYQVIVSNPYGAKTSAPVTLVVEAPSKPVILWQPYGDTVGVGGCYNFSVVAAGTQPLDYQWFKDGSELTAATNRNLTFVPVDFTNAGIYAVRVQNNAGIAWSLGAKLVVTNAIAGGGQISFRNRFSSLYGTNVDAPIFDIDGATGLNGSNFLAQLYGGPSLELLRPAGQPSAFKGGFSAGYFFYQIVTLPAVPPGSGAVVQVRAWDARKGSSYEEARAMGGKFGKSTLLTLTTGDDWTGPADLDGLQSFSLQAGMPQFASGQIAFVERQPGNIVVWSHRGEPGYRYLIERSIHGFEWRPYLVITNVTSTATFTDSAEGGSSVVFYRSRILD